MCFFSFFFFFFILPFNLYMIMVLFNVSFRIYSCSWFVGFSFNFLYFLFFAFQVFNTYFCRMLLFSIASLHLFKSNSTLRSFGCDHAYTIFLLSCFIFSSSLLFLFLSFLLSIFFFFLLYFFHISILLLLCHLLPQFSLPFIITISFSSLLS